MVTTDSLSKRLDAIDNTARRVPPVVVIFRPADMTDAEFTAHHTERTAGIAADAMIIVVRFVRTQEA